MRLKQVSKRQWKARMMLGRWIPAMVLEKFDLQAPEGFTFIWHPVEDFLKIVPIGDDDA
jgi:hypothetical protein